MPQMLPGERRAVSVIALIGMLRMFGLFALLPVLALYVRGLEDATPLLIGLAVLVFAFVIGSDFWPRMPANWYSERLSG